MRVKATPQADDGTCSVLLLRFFCFQKKEISFDSFEENDDEYPTSESALSHNKHLAFHFLWSFSR